jgi:CRP-like cAMP-binding protein
MNAIRELDGALKGVIAVTSTGHASVEWGHQRRRWEHPSLRTFLHSLNATEREALMACAQERIYWAGSALCRQDQVATDVMVIKSGWAKVSMETDGQERIVAWRTRGDLVGERATLFAAARSATVVALDDVCALVIPAERFRAVLDDHPRILEVLRRQEDERLAEDADGLSAHEWGDVQRRLARLLHELALRRGEFQPEGPITLSLPVSAQDLADWVDARQDAIGWCLNSWRAEGIVATTARQLMIADAAALEMVFRDAVSWSAVRPRSGWGAHALPRAPLNYSIFATDIVGFGARYRDDDDRRLVREALYGILREVFDASEAPWAACVHEDRGDGALTVVPPEVPTVSLVDPLLVLLAARLKRYNRRAGDSVRIQLRAALHVGPVSADAQGLHGIALIQAARMLDARILKARLAATGADLGFVASAHVYDTVIRQCAGLVEPDAYCRIRTQVKESTMTGWMYLAGGDR